MARASFRTYPHPTKHCCLPPRNLQSPQRNGHDNVDSCTTSPLGYVAASADSANGPAQPSAAPSQWSTSIGSHSMASLGSRSRLARRSELVAPKRPPQRQVSLRVPPGPPGVALEWGTTVSSLRLWDRALPSGASGWARARSDWEKERALSDTSKPRAVSGLRMLEC